MLALDADSPRRPELSTVVSSSASIPYLTSTPPSPWSNTLYKNFQTKIMTAPAIAHDAAVMKAWWYRGASVGVSG